MRLVYFYLVVLGLLAGLAWLLGKVGLIIPDYHIQLSAWLLNLMRNYPRESVAFIIGFCTGGAAHTIADWLVTGGKRYLRSIGLRVTRDYRDHDRWRPRVERRAHTILVEMRLEPYLIPIWRSRWIPPCLTRRSPICWSSPKASSWPLCAARSAPKIWPRRWRHWQTPRAAQSSSGLAGAARAEGRSGAAGEGIGDLDTARDAALDAALLCTPPLVLPLPQILRHGQANLLLIQVPLGLPHVYSVHGKYLRRAGLIDQPIPPDALRKLLIERGETSWERLAPADTTLDELNPNKIAAYVRRIGPAAEGDGLAFLFRRGCLMRVRRQLSVVSCRLISEPTDHGPRTTDHGLCPDQRWPAAVRRGCSRSSGTSRSARSRWCATVAAI